MNTYPAMFAAVATVFVVTGVGAIARRLKWLTAEADASLIKLAVRILFPALVFYTMTQPGRLSGAGGLLVPAVLGFVLAALGFALAGGAAWLLRQRAGFQTRPQRATFALCVGIFNYAFLPVPLLKQIMPEATGTLSTLFLFNVGVEISMWTVGLLLLSGKLGRQVITGIFNPVVIAILIALLLNATGSGQGRWPSWLKNSVEMLALSAIPVSLIVTGATIADVWRAARFTDGKWTVAAAVVLRLGLLPTLFLLCARWLPITHELRTTVALQAAMPSALFPIVLARHYGGDTPTAVRVVLATSLLGLLTIPAWLVTGLK